MFEDSIKIALDEEGWFDMASLVAIARCGNKQLHALVDRDHLWEQFLAEIKFPQAGFVETADWKSPEIPSEDVVSNLRIPPRINGWRRDDHCFFVHPRDKQARGRGLVLVNQKCVKGALRFDQTTGILMDCFIGENDDCGDYDNHDDHMSSCVYIPRASPIECTACRAMLDSYPALVAHCKQWSHMQNEAERHGRRVPEEFEDPRDMPSYHDEHFSVFGKVMALKTFEHKFIAFLHDSLLDQDGIDNLTAYHENVLDRMSGDQNLHNMDWDCLLSTHLEKARKTCIELVLADFHNEGIDSCSCLEAILGGSDASNQALHEVILGQAHRRV
jgi:hypothetical protein